MKDWGTSYLTNEIKHFLKKKYPRFSLRKLYSEDSGFRNETIYTIILFDNKEREPVCIRIFYQCYVGLDLREEILRQLEEWIND